MIYRPLMAKQWRSMNLNMNNHEQTSKKTSNELPLTVSVNVPTFSGRAKLPTGQSDAQSARWRDFGPGEWEQRCSASAGRARIAHLRWGFRWKEDGFESMCICMYVIIQLYMYVWFYVCVCVWIYIYIWLYVYTLPIKGFWWDRVQNRIPTSTEPQSSHKYFFHAPNPPGIDLAGLGFQIL